MAVQTSFYRLLIAGAFALGALGLSDQPVFAGEADVIDVKFEQRGDRVYDFHVTVSHGDEGWDHYADAWEIVVAGEGTDMSVPGTVLARRVLLHPHTNEQPFTRSLGGVKIPADVTQVLVRAHDSVHALGGATMTINLP